MPAITFPEFWFAGLCLLATKKTKFKLFMLWSPNSEEARYERNVIWAKLKHGNLLLSFCLSLVFYHFISLSIFIFSCRVRLPACCKEPPCLQNDDKLSFVLKFWCAIHFIQGIIDVYYKPLPKKHNECTIRNYQVPLSPLTLDKTCDSTHEGMFYEAGELIG